MRFFLYCFIFIALSFQHSFGQENNNSNRQQVYLELGGAAPYGSLNYEYAVLKKEKLCLTGRIGISSMKIIDYRRKFNPDIIVPLTVSLIYGKRHCIEILAGNTFSSKVFSKNFYESGREFSVNGTFGVFYRYRMAAIPVRLRIGYSPILEEYQFYRHWFALSVGYSF